MDAKTRAWAEARLAGNENKFCDITSSLAEGIYVLNKDGQITTMNPEAERLLGWTEKEIIGKNAHDLIHCRKVDGEQLSFEDCPIHNITKSGGRYVSEKEVFTRKDGSTFFVSVVTSPIVASGKIIASVTAFRDITARKKMDEEILKLKKIESISILAGGIAHDFNNLLHAILGNISFAKMNIHSEDKVLNLLTEAENACQQAKELSFRLITFSKGGDPVKRVAFVAPLIKEAALAALRGSSVSCTFSLGEDLSPVEIDEGQMKQVFRNIILNAAEAMPDGGTIRVDAHNIILTESDNPLLKKGPHIKISIQDQGIGIPGESLSKIFDPYFTTKPMAAQKGMGLGLAICQAIIKKHDGFITVESKVRAGTTVHIYLPASDSRRSYADNMKRDGIGD